MKSRWMGLLCLAVILGMILYAGITLSNMKTKVSEANRTEQELQGQVEELQEENAALRYAIDNQDDPDTIGDIAREKLGLVMEDEIIYYDGGN